MISHDVSPAIKHMCISSKKSRPGPQRDHQPIPTLSRSGEEEFSEFWIPQAPELVQASEPPGSHLAMEVGGDIFH